MGSYEGNPIHWTALKEIPEVDGAKSEFLLITNASILWGYC